MTDEQKKFILDELIPFILRENGRGFAMSVWIHRTGAVRRGHLDGHSRKTPECGTVACLAGSIEMLIRTGLDATLADTISTAGRAIGLTSLQSGRLFFDASRWPNPYYGRWLNAPTCLGRARVAVALLKQVVATDGRVLDDE